MFRIQKFYSLNFNVYTTALHCFATIKVDYVGNFDIVLMFYASFNSFPRSGDKILHITQHPN